MYQGKQKRIWIWGLAAVLALSACGTLETGGQAGVKAATAAFKAYRGSPSSATSLAFMPDGAPVIVGGSQYGGSQEAQYFRQSDSLWVRARDLPELRASDYLMRKGEKVYLRYKQKELYRLEDAGQFMFKKLELGDQSDVKGEILGFAGDESVFYATTYNLIAGNPMLAMASWSPGQTKWTLIPGAEQIKSSVMKAGVDERGNITFSTGDGIYQGNAAGVRKIVDCNVPELLYCQSHLNQLVVDAKGNVTFALAPELNDVRGIFRIEAGGSGYTRIASEPEKHPYMASLQQLPDGSLYLLSGSHITNHSDRVLALYRMAPGKNSWELKLDNMDPTNYEYVVRDASTLFRIGAGHYRAGVDSVTF